jgi:hypothetical protein
MKIFKRLALVFIRLVSPASGNEKTHLPEESLTKVSIRLVSPASGDSYILNTVPVRSLEALSEVQET